MHTYGKDPSYRCLHVQLPKGITAATPKADADPLSSVDGHGCGHVPGIWQQQFEDGDARGDSDPITIEITGELKDKNATLFHPFTTTLVEVVLNRVPYPFDKVQGIFEWLPPFTARTE